MSLLYISDEFNQLALVDPNRGLTAILMQAPPTLDIARAPDGRIWGVNNTELYLLDPDTHAATLVGNLNFSINFIIPPVNSLAYDPVGDRLIAAAGSVDTLLAIDTATGAAAVLLNTGTAYPDGDIEIVGDRILESTDTHQIVSIGLDGSVVPLMGHHLFGVYGLAMLADGRLIGVDGLTTTRLWQLDTVTGDVSPLADLSDSGLGLGYGAAAGPAMTSLVGGDFGDTLTGDDGANDMTGGSGADVIIGGGGIDVILAGAGADLIYGNQDTDMLLGDLGADTIFAGQGQDLVQGGDDDDLLYGNLASDTISGEAGQDMLYGGRGGDVLDGGAGADTLIGNRGDDALTGGADGDLFVFTGAFGHDVITDYTLGIDHVLLALAGGQPALDAILAAAIQASDGLRIEISATESITFAGLSAGQLTNADFSLIV